MSASTASTPAIRVDGVSLTYEGSDGSVRALRDVSFRVDPGVRLAIIGPSGSGKTSLVELLGGVREPDGGSIRVLDRRLDQGDSPSSRVGHVFQEFGLVPQLTALENVCCGRLADYQGADGLFGFSTDDRRRAAELLRGLGLERSIHQRTSTLSGGEKQRVGIARLLCQAPSTVLMDEPVSNLDIHWATEAMRQIGALADGDATVVGVFHDLGLVRSWADRVLVLEHGQIVFDGAPGEGCRRLENLDPFEVEGETDADPSADPNRDGSTVEADSSGEESPPATAPPVSAPDGPFLDRRTFYAAIFLLFVGGWGWSTWDMELGPGRLAHGLGESTSFLGRLFPPNLEVVPTVFDAIVETVQMAFLGTTIAAIIALPLAILAAKNVARFRLPWRLRAVCAVVGGVGAGMTSLTYADPWTTLLVVPSLVALVPERPRSRWLQAVVLVILGAAATAQIALSLPVQLLFSLALTGVAVNHVVPGGVARFVLVVLRTVPSIIWGLFFVNLFGLGALPGILALTFYAGGYLGKFYYEGIEAMSESPVRALETMGANRIQAFRYGVFPQALPLLVGYTIYMFEYNVREASILGVVGAGGIGYYLKLYIEQFEYPKVATALGMLVLVVILVDAASSTVRHYIQE